MNNNSKYGLGILLLALAILPFASAELFYPNNQVWTGGIPNTTIFDSNDPVYPYEVDATYNAFFSEQPTSGNGIKFVTKQGNELLLQPNPLNYRNDVDDIQQISTPQSITGTVTDNIINYANAYGSGISLSYEANPTQVKELLTINSFSDLPAPAAYITDDPGVVLELTFNLVADDKIIIDGVEWDKSSTITTSNDVVVRDAATNEVIYYLNKPYAYDSNGDTVYGYYQFKKQGNKLYIGQRISYDWLSTATYPVYIDPTYTVDYSPLPGTYLELGDPYTYEDVNFTNTSDITTGISDDNSTTNYLIRAGLQTTGGLSGVQLLFNYKMDLSSGNIMHDAGPQHNDGTYNNSPNLTVTGFNGFAKGFDGVDNFALAPNKAGAFNVNSSEEIMVCFGLRQPVGASFGNNMPILDFRDGAASGWAVVGADQELRFVSDRDGSGGKNHNFNYQFDTDNEWHAVCAFSGFSNIVSYIDGALDKTASQGQSGAITTDNANLYIGTNTDIDEFGRFDIDELCYLKGTNLNHSQIAKEFNESRECDTISMDYTKGYAIAGHWSQTHETPYQYFLRLKKERVPQAEFIVYGYYNNGSLDTARNATLSTDGTGWFNINVTHIVDYQTNTLGMNYTELRLTSLQSTNISEIRLRKEANDTQVPTITACQVDNPTTFHGEVARFQCNVTDDVDVDYVQANISGNYVNLTKSGDTYYYDQVCGAVGEDQTYNMTYVYAQDLLGQSNTSNPGVINTCRRHCDYKGTGVWNIFRQYTCEISTAFSDAYNFITVQNTKTTTYSSNVDQFGNTTIDQNSTLIINSGSSMRVGG